MKRSAFVLAGSAATLAARTAGAQAAPMISTADAIARLFTAPALQPEWFSALFLAQIPLAQMTPVVRDIAATLGPYQSIAANGDGYVLTFARGTIRAHAAQDATGAFTGLLFNRMQSAAAADRITEMFTGAPVPAAWFSDRMLASVPIDRIDAIVATMRSQLGAFRSVTPSNDGTYDVAFANGHATGQIFLGADGKIEGLIFQPLTA